MTRARRLDSGIALVALALIALSPAMAQTRYPTRPVRIVSPFAAGSVSDISRRLFADKLAPRLNGQIIVDNQRELTNGLSKLTDGQSQLRMVVEDIRSSVTIRLEGNPPT